MVSVAGSPRSPLGGIGSWDARRGRGFVALGGNAWPLPGFFFGSRVGVEARPGFKLGLV